MVSMDYEQLQAYVGFWAGATVMISVHNMFVSFFLYKARQTNISNILKIVFNLGNILRFAAGWGLFMTPFKATILQCTSIQYITAIGNSTTRVALTAFLLWRLKQINNLKVDNIVGIILFALRAGLGIAILGVQRPGLETDPETGRLICFPNVPSSKFFTFAGVVLELVVDVYVTGRLIQVLHNANRNAASISSNMANKTKRTLFTAVMYWNFIRLFVSLLFHFTPILNLIIVNTRAEDSQINQITMVSVINIVLSYVVTVDAEIVRVIEGRGKKNDSTYKSNKSHSQSPRTPRTPGYSPGGDLPKYSPRSHNQTFDETYSQIDDDKIAVVSMKRLSFFEWANVVVGKRLRRNDDEQYEEENTEEIIDGPSEVKEEVEADLEKGISQDRRSSNFSGTTSATETSTLDGNTDITTNK